jgi:2'-5' RNA ligase
LDSTQEFRLFIALTIPDAVKSTIENAQAKLRRVVPAKAARWARREQFHLTLRFLGNVPASRVEDLVGLTRPVFLSFASLRLRAARIGFFPNPRSPRVIWVGINDMEDRLGALWRSVQTATQPFSGEPQENAFTGHVTLARVTRLRREQAEELAGSAAQFDNTVFGEWTANEAALMRSELLPQGARHSLVTALALGAASN